MGIFKNSGIGGFLERIVGGKAASSLGPDSLKLGAAGDTEDAFGAGIVNEGLGNLRGLASQYQDQINAGGLPDALRQQFRVLRGGLSDDATRLQRDFLAKMQQKLLTQPGFNPNAAAEYELENEQNVGQNLFTATNQANMSEANLALTNTNKLFDRLDSIGNTFVNTGETERDRALAKIGKSLDLRYQRNKAIADNISSYFGARAGGNKGQFFGNSNT